MASEKQNLIFISYSRTNKDFALELANELRASGFNIWFDLLDIPTGSRWDDEIERALERCEIFMVILTPSSTISDNVKDEIGYAIDSDKRILPILLKDANVPLRLRRFQYVDFTDISYNEGIDRAKELLRKLINESARSALKQDSVDTQSPQPDSDRSAELHADAQRLARQKAEAIRKAREKEQLEQLSQADSLAPISQKREVKPQPQKQPTSKIFSIGGAVALLSILCIGGGYIAWTNFPRPTPTYTPTNTPTNTPSPTPTLTATIEAPPEITPTTPVPQGPDPVQTVINYVSYFLDPEDYQLAWNLLSPSFQQRNHNGDFENYRTSRENDRINNYCRIETTNGQLINSDSSTATVSIQVIYYMKPDCWSNPYDFVIELIYDNAKQMWLYDSGKATKAN